MPTPTPDVVVQGFGPGAAAYFERLQLAVADLTLLVEITSLMLVCFVVAGVVRYLARPHR